MAYSYSIDTLKFTCRLIHPEFKRRSPEDVFDTDLSDFATKAEVAALRAEIAELHIEFKADIASIEAKMAAHMADLNEQIKAGFAELRAAILRRMWLMSGCIVVAIVGLVKVLP